MRLIRTAVTAAFLLSFVLLPHPALADGSPKNSITTVSPLSGAYGDAIGVWIEVDEPGTYHICWDSPYRTASTGEIHAHAAGNFSGQFVVPEAPGGNHTAVLHLVKVDGQSLATASFGIYPTAMMSPNKGPVGTVVTIKGYGFDANETGIPIEFRGSEIKQARADAKGSWEETYSIPELPTGSYPFDVGPDKLNERYWHMHFTVTPEISISKSSGVAGEVIEVSGTGFAANEKGIRITFHGEKVKDGISAGADGSFSDEEIVIPRRGRGTYEIGASGFSTWARDVPPVDFTIETGVSVSPTEAYVGDEVAVMGSGFAAWETGIRVSLGARDVDTGTITADRYGTWEASFVVPTSTFGDKTVSARGDTTPAAAVKTAPVKVLASIQVTPLEASPGDSVTVTGTGFPGDQALTVTFANRAVPETVRSLSNGDLSYVVTVPASPVGTLSVTATGGGAEASTDFTVTTKTLDTPQPVSPEEDRKLRSGEVEFAWGRITTDKDVAITYTLRISGAGGSQMYADLDGLSFTIPADEALDRGQYEWQVRAVDEFENESEWSAPVPFEVSPIPTWVWVLVGLVVFTTLMTVAYREGRFKITE